MTLVGDGIFVARGTASQLRQRAQRSWLSPDLTDHAVWEDFARSVRHRRV